MLDLLVGIIQQLDSLFGWRLVPTQACWPASYQLGDPASGWKRKRNQTAMPAAEPGKF
jgi:hypothetical protein